MVSVWIPGHEGYQANERADGLSQEGCYVYHETKKMLRRKKLGHLLARALL